MRLTTTPPSRAKYEVWEPKPPGTIWATPGLLRDSFIKITNVQYNYVEILHTEFEPDGLLNIHSVNRNSFIILSKVWQSLNHFHKTQKCLTVV
jgi:hypothetical protein